MKRRIADWLRALAWRVDPHIEYAASVSVQVGRLQVADHRDRLADLQRYIEESRTAHEYER